MSETNTKPTFTPRLLVQSSAKFHINAPTSAIDITDWLFNVDEAEYIACTPQSARHLSAGFTHAPDGKRMSINIEDVGGALIVEHYVEKIGEKLHCRVVSTSHLLIDREYTTAQVTWELIATPAGGNAMNSSTTCGSTPPRSTTLTWRHIGFLSKPHATPFRPRSTHTTLRRRLSSLLPLKEKH